MGKTLYVHEQLKFIRKHHNLTQKELGGKLGISNTYLSEIENGNRRIHIDLLEKYSEIFEISIGSILVFSQVLEE